MKTTVPLALLFLAVLGYGAWTTYTAPSIYTAPTQPVALTTTTTSTPEPAPKPAPTPTPTAGTYTAAQVAAHASGSSCWTSINGNVYDVTRWITQHPGGPEAILSLCGTDGSAAFNAQHGGERRPASELASFKIGTLAP